VAVKGHWTGIDSAFISINLPSTMDSAMAADAVRAFKSRLVYPYHTRRKEGDQGRRVHGIDARI